MQGGIGITYQHKILLCNTGYSLPHMKCSTQCVKIEFAMIVYTKIKKKDHNLDAFCDCMDVSSVTSFTFMLIAQHPVLQPLRQLISNTHNLPIIS